MKRFFGLLLIVLCLAVSCSGNEFSVTDVITQAYVSKSTNEMGLCVYAMTDSNKEQTVSFEVTNPEGNLTWTVNAQKQNYDGCIYYGSSDIRMPASSMLEKGKYKLTVISDDGSSEDFYFDVDYSYTREDDISDLPSGRLANRLNITVID